MVDDSKCLIGMKTADNAVPLYVRIPRSMLLQVQQASAVSALGPYDSAELTVDPKDRVRSASGRTVQMPLDH